MESRRRVNVVLDVRARCIRILFADGYEIDILGDPTREAHGTNKRRGTDEDSVQISSAFCYGVSRTVLTRKRNCTSRMPEEYADKTKWPALIGTRHQSPVEPECHRFVIHLEYDF